MVYTVPSTYIATSNGLLTSTIDNGNGTKTYTWVENHPITTYLISITAFPFSSFSHTYVPIGGGSMPVVYYVYPPDLTKERPSARPRDDRVLRPDVRRVCLRR
jgi:aminopeptidase N